MCKIVILSVLLVVCVVSLTPPEEATVQFMASLKKHVRSGDSDIMDKNFFFKLKDGNIARGEKFIEELMDEWRKSGIADKNDENSSGEELRALYTDDGMLKIKFFKNGLLKFYFLCKPSRYIEGGFKFYAIVIIRD